MPLKSFTLFILPLSLLCVLAFLSIQDGWCEEAAPAEYAYVFYESTFHNQNIVVDGREVPIQLDRERSDAEALRSLRALKWNVLYPNSEGKIHLVGYLGPEIERPYGERVNLFILLDWYLPAPFEYMYIKGDENILPFEYATRIKSALDKDDFEVEIANPQIYNRF
jgi:hypothetical protein